MRVRRKKRTKRLIVLLSLLLLGIVGFRNILPNLGDVFQYHHVASGEYGWNLILVNRDNYIPDDYTVELTELSNGQKVDSRIYPSLQEMFDAARAEGLGLFVADCYRTAETQQKRPSPACSRYAGRFPARYSRHYPRLHRSGFWPPPHG